MDNFIRNQDVGAPGNGGQFAAHRNTAPGVTLERQPLNGGVRPDAQTTGRGSLSDLMDFDHVITVTDGGIVYDGPAGLFAPSAYDPDQDATTLEDWQLLTGHTGQHGYRGPWMHESEQISGRIAEDILDTPGHYVAVYSQHDDPDDPDGETIVGGWAIAYKPLD